MADKKLDALLDAMMRVMSSDEKTYVRARQAIHDYVGLIDNELAMWKSLLEKNVDDYEELKAIETAFRRHAMGQETLTPEQIDTYYARERALWK